MALTGWKPLDEEDELAEAEDELAEAEDDALAAEEAEGASVTTAAE